MAAIPCRELRSRSTRAQHHWSDTAHASNHGEPMTSTDPRELVSRYVAVWNEPDPQQRREAIRDLWAKDGAHTLQPPQEIREAAAELGFPSTVLEARGHDALQIRVSRAYQEFVAPGKFTFQPRGNADRLGNVVKFNWDMVPTGGGEAAGAGLEILVLDEDGRITSDYQFIEG